MTSHSEDEAFDNSIEEMENDDKGMDKENKKEKNDKAKTKTEQIAKIIAFLKSII